MRRSPGSLGRAFLPPALPSPSHCGHQLSSSRPRTATSSSFFFFSSSSSPEKEDYSSTLNLPNTSFPLRADALNREPGLQPLIQTQLYAWQQKAFAQRQSFTLHDGPPYANGDLHIGHFLNKTLKDITNRYHLLTGARIDFVPGWDCHGLPIELKALATAGKEANGDQGLTAQQIRRKAREFALKTVEKQKKQFMKWGILGDWDNSYQTLDPPYEAEQLRVFQQMYQKGMIYRGWKPVHW